MTESDRRSECDEALVPSFEEGDADKVFVDLAGAFAAFADGPYHEGLAAAQAYQPAIETSAFKDANGQGHGLLTYALVEEGLAQGKAGNSDGNVYLREWLDYAAQEVPQLQSEWLTGAVKTGRGFKDESGGAVNPTDPSQVGLQRPRVFYRRENDANPFLVGKVGVAPAAQ